MIIDKKLQLTGASGQAVTVTAPTTDVVDVGNAYSDIGSSEKLDLAINVSTTATAGGAATVTFALQDSADNTTFTDLSVTKAYPVAELVAGKQIVIPVPPSARRYVRGNFTVATGPLTAGVFNANIVNGAQRNVAYPNASAIGAT